MFRKNLNFIDNQDGSRVTVQLQSQDGFRWEPAQEDGADDTGYGHATVDGRHFVLQTKGEGLQVLAETNTPTKAARIAESL